MQFWVLRMWLGIILTILTICIWNIAAKNGGALRIWLRIIALLTLMVMWFGRIYIVETELIMKRLSTLMLGIGLMLASICEMKFLYSEWRDSRKLGQ